MSTPLAKLAIGLSAAAATGFYYLAAAPPAAAVIDVCGPGNFSSPCADNSPSPQAEQSPTEPQPEASPAARVKAAPEPAPVAPAPAPPEPVLAAPASADPAPILLAPSPSPILAPSPRISSIYSRASVPRSTAIPEPGTVTALLLTGAGIFCSGIKRSKQVGQQR